MRVLLVEDDASVRDALVRDLDAEDYVVEVTDSGEEAAFLGATEDYDAIILDLSLPDIDGLAVLEGWRNENVETPVLVLTARGSWLDRVEGINRGADDYLPKPFRVEELVARLGAIIRRSKGHASAQIACSGVVLDLIAKTVAVDGREVELAPLEFRALAHLMQNSGQTISAHELMEHIYGVHAERNTNALEALILRLRKKTRVSLIRTRRGIGYIVDADLTKGEK